jgi:hypothetical protein
MRRIISVSLFVLCRLSASQLYTSASYSYGPAFGFDTGQAHAALPFVSFNLGPDITGSAAAEAHSSYLSLGTYALFTTFNTMPTQISEAGAFAMAQMEDVVTPTGGVTGQPGLMIFTFEVSGTNTSMLSGDALVGKTSFGTSTVVQGCNVPPIAVTPLPFNACTSSAETFDGASYSHVPVTFSFGIVYGDQTAVVFSMNSQTGVRFDPTHAISFSGVTDFLHTMNLTSVELLDQNGQQITNGTLLAESGTIYPIAGVSAVGGVPEPGTLVLLLVGIAALYVRSLRQRMSPSVEQNALRG